MKLKWLIIVIILSLDLVSAQTIDKLNIQFEIQDDLSVKENLTFSFSELYYDEITEYSLNEKVTDISVYDDSQKLDYKLNNSKLEIYLVKPTNKLSISFKTDKTIFRNSDVYHFFTELNFEKQDIRNFETKLILPLNYGLYNHIYKPENGVISSDGKRVILTWNNLDTKQPIFFSVKFTKLNSNTIFFFIIFGLIGGIGLIYVLYKRKLGKAISYGFSEDEQKAIDYIKNKGTIWQKELQKEFKFSRAKSTRIIKKLESKNLIKKEDFGRTNKISWKPFRKSLQEKTDEK